MGSHFGFDLARKIDPDQPLYFVTLTAEDLSSLGHSPDLESIGARIVKKILATQPKGPQTIGGFCLGGILAYEIALQLRAAGYQVALLVLVDPPNPSYVEPRMRCSGWRTICPMLCSALRGWARASVLCTSTDT